MVLHDPRKPSQLERDLDYMTLVRRAAERSVKSEIKEVDQFSELWAQAQLDMAEEKKYA